MNVKQMAAIKARMAGKNQLNPQNLMREVPKLTVPTGLTPISSPMAPAMSPIGGMGRFGKIKALLGKK